MSELSPSSLLLFIGVVIVVIASIRWYRENYNAKTFLDRGIAHFDAGDIELAIEQLSRAIAYDPQLVEAYFQRGVAHSRRFNFEAAIVDFSQAIQLDPGFFEAYRQRAKLQIALNVGGINELIADWTRLLQIRPDLIEIHDERASLYVKQGELDKAIADYDQMIAKKPDAVDAYRRRAFLHLVQNRQEQTLADFDHIVRLTPHDPVIYNERGLLRESLRDIRGAIADYEQSITIKPDFADACFNLGLAYRRLNDVSNAHAQINKAMAIRAQFNKDIQAESYAITSAYLDWLRLQGSTEVDMSHAFLVRSVHRFAELNPFGIDKSDGAGAMTDLDYALQLNPKLALAYLCRGLLYAEQGKSLLALRDAFHFVRSGGISEVYNLVLLDSQQRNEPELLPSEAEFTKQFWSEINEMIRETVLSGKK